MSTMTLTSLLAGIVDAPALTISGLTLDSRAVHLGDAFVALQGGSGHGIEHAAQAIERGAVAILSDRASDTPLAVPVVVIVQLRALLGDIASRFHGNAKVPRLIGVTGTNGKTSTVQLIADALTRAGLSAGTIGTLGCGMHGAVVAGERTTPDVLSMHAAIAAMRAQGADAVAMEVSSHALDQGRVDALPFEIAVFTNLTHDHLDYHGNMQAYGAAKALLFQRPELRVAVLNLDDAFSSELLRINRAARTITVSADGKVAADLRAEHINVDARGIEFELVQGAERHVIQSALLGHFNVANLLAVAGVLLGMNWTLDEIAAQLGALAPVAGRMNRLGGDGSTPLIVVDYAHTPDALEKALSTLRPHTQGNLICVFGCGGDRDRGKRPQMGAIVERLADSSIITDDNPRSEDGDTIVAAIRAGMSDNAQVRIERDRRRAIRNALAIALHDDTVLIAGKGHERYQEIAGVKHHFDDLEEAAAAIALYGVPLTDTTTAAGASA